MHVCLCRYAVSLTQRAMAARWTVPVEQGRGFERCAMQTAHRFQVRVRASAACSISWHTSEAGLQDCRPLLGSALSPQLRLRC